MAKSEKKVTKKLSPKKTSLPQSPLKQVSFFLKNEFQTFNFLVDDFNFPPNEANPAVTEFENTYKANPEQIAAFTESVFFKIDAFNKWVKEMNTLGPKSVKIQFLVYTQEFANRIEILSGGTIKATDVPIGRLSAMLVACSDANGKNDINNTFGAFNLGGLEPNP